MFTCAFVSFKKTIYLKIQLLACFTYPGVVTTPFVDIFVVEHTKRLL